jgi:hypothetical protein
MPGISALHERNNVSKKLWLVTVIGTAVLSAIIHKLTSDGIDAAMLKLAGWGTIIDDPDEPESPRRTPSSS